MFSIIPEKNEDLPDVVDFVEKLNGFQQKTNFFEPEREIFVARAPGRLDLMGGIADYSGSLVLQRPIAEATFAAVQPIDRPVLELVSLGRPSSTVSLDTLAPSGAPPANCVPAE